MDFDSVNLNPYRLEEWLEKRLPWIELLGQLQINEAAFNSICDVIQKYYINFKNLAIKKTPPTIFTTSMVFSARYSRHDARNFWDPYAQIVWKEENASQYFQKLCREKFHTSVLYLEENFDLVFPQRSKGDVVRPVFKHAIIPYYLQDDFASWLKDKWKIILEIPQHELVEQLILDKSYRYLPSTLRNFISNEDTKDTASNLILTISTAAEMYTENKDAQRIDLLLRENPIERDLWHELLKEYQKSGTDIGPKRRGHSIDWIWDVQKNELVLRIRNVHTDIDEIPDRVVWIDQDQDPLQTTLGTRLNPWRQKDGWLIDECYLDGGELDGELVVISQDDEILEAFPIPRLPTDKPVLFFRVVNNGLFGEPVELTSQNIKEGDWLISKAEAVDILAKDPGKFDLIQNLPVPYPFNNLVGHSKAGIFHVRPPFDVTRGDLLLASFEQQTTRSGKPEIISSHESRVEGLSPSNPPIFLNRDFSLKVTNLSNHVINRGTLWIQSQTETITHRLEVLLSGEEEYLEDNNLVIPIGKLIPDKPALYTLQIRIGLTPVFSAPISFGFLPHINITSPNIQDIYYPNHYPICNIQGIQREKIKGRLSTNIEQDDYNSILITWTDLRDNPHIAIEVDDERIPLTWDVQRINVWLEPPQEILSVKEFKNCKLNAFSNVDDIRNFEISIRDAKLNRQISLSAKGEYSSKVLYDPILDLINEHPKTIHLLDIHMGGKTWVLGKIQEGITVNNPNLTIKEHIVTGGIGRQINFTADVEKTWKGETKYTAKPIWQSEDEVVLDKSDQLSGVRHIICGLDKGIYQFQVIHLGDELLNPPLLFYVGSRIENKSINLEILSHYIDNNFGKIDPQPILNNLIDLFSLEVEETKELRPQYRYYLFTLPAKRLKEYGREKLEIFGSSVDVILNAYLECYSLRDDGLFPSWMIIESPLMFKLILPKKELLIKVHALYSSYQAKHGFGYTYLKVRGENEPEDKILVLWDIRGRNQYDIEMGIPDENVDKEFSDLDIYDVWPLRQCINCGEVIVTRRTQADEELHNLHKHDKSKPDLIDITYEFDLLAQITPAKQEEVLDCKDSISEWIDRKWAVQQIKANIDKLNQPENIMSLDGYKYAISCISTLLNSDKKYKFWQWFSKESWQHGLSAFENLIMNESISIPAYGPSKRLLSALQWDGGEKAVNIDKHCFLLSLLLRGQAYHKGQSDQILSKINLKINDLVKMLDFLESIAPEMMQWGLAMAEVFYNHALS